MDLHIERPELNAKTAEENIATVDTWIADTSDKLNIALTTLNNKVNSVNNKSSGNASGSGNSSVAALEAKVPYLGDYKVEVSKLILGGQ